MIDAAGERGTINARRLGKFIARHERRVEGSLRFEQGGLRHGVATWRVVELGGMEGFEGLSPAHTRKSHAKKDNQEGANPQNPPNPLDQPRALKPTDDAELVSRWRTVF